MRPRSTPSLFQRHRRLLAALALAIFSLTSVGPALAGGYVDGSVVLNPATAINTGAVSITPTFNNDQFNDRVLVGTVNNDPVRTPSTADPVSTVSGNNYHDETDFTIRGRNGLNLVFTRTYNSAPSSTSVDRGLGYGWTHSYLMRLQSNDFGACPNCTSAQKPENANNLTSSITYTDERGGEQAFLVNETSYAVTNPKGVYDTLTLDSPAAGQHTLAFRNGVKYIFEVPSGSLKTTPGLVARLKYIDNAWGDRLTLTYDASGRLSTITDNLGIAGRTGLVLTYDANGRLKDVTDWSARQWRYGYDPAGNLVARTNPLNETLAYTYHAGHLLNEIVQPLARDGLPVKTAFKYYQNSRVFNYANSLGHTETLDYDLYRKSTSVTDPRGGIREYFYDDNGRMTKLVEPDGGVLLFENQGDAIRSKKYDAQGYATTYSYRADRAFTGTSDANGNVTREQDALARTVDTTYAALDQIATVKDKRGTLTTTTYASSTSGCDYANRPRETRISTLSGITNVLLASQCWNSDATLNYSRQYLDATRYIETRLTYDPASNGLNVSQQQTVGMPSGAAITQTFTYDTLGRKKTETLKRRAGPTNAALMDLTTSYDYDALDRVTKITDALGNEVVNSYDANGQLWKVTHRYKKPDATYEVRDVVTRTFDAADRVKTETDADGSITSYTYDAAGNVIVVTDAENHVTRFEYDPMNRRTAVIDATGYKTTTAYTLRGDVIAVTNANGETVKFEYDALGRKTAAIDAKGYRSEFQYDENGNLVCTVDANAQAGLQPRNTLGCSESRAYDELNRVTKIVDALNNETVFTYDLFGNRLTVKDAENKTWSFAFDELGRLISETDHSGKTIAYQPDEAGNVFEKTNRLNEVTRFTFDNGNRVTRVDYLKDGTAETFGYDPAGNLNAVANNTVGYSFGYDRLNRLLVKLDSRGKNLAFTYDKVGNMLTKTTYQGSTTSYTYNAANRLVMLRNPDYLQVDYQYDPAGRLLSRVTSAGARTTRQFDANGALTRLTQYDAANALISDTSYTRDRTGNILTQTDAAGTTRYAYDALYRITQAVAAGSVNVAAAANGATASASSALANGGYGVYAAGGAIDGAGRGRWIQDCAPACAPASAGPGWEQDHTPALQNTVQTLDITFAGPHQIDTVNVFFVKDGFNLNHEEPAPGLTNSLYGVSAFDVQTWNGSAWSTAASISGNNLVWRPVSFAPVTTAKIRIVVKQAMDGWARIVEVEALDSSQGQTETFAYDKVGNRVSHTRSGVTRYYNYLPGSNRLLDIRVGSASGTVESGFTFDAEGRLTAQTGTGAKTLAWDAQGRVKTLNGETYRYDPMDYRIGRSGGALGNLDYFLEGEHLESVYSGANLHAKYFRGSSIDELVAGYLYDTDAKLKPYLFHHDNVTSTTAVSGHNGGTIQSTSYGAFGNILNTIGTSSNRLKYTGREDDGTGLYYYRARYYDPAIGRFISEDPLGFEAGINFYAYVHNNPVNANDPSGLIGEGKLAELAAKGINNGAQLLGRARARVQDLWRAWNDAPPGANGGRLCNNCGTEVVVPPKAGQPRDWHFDHYPEKFGTTQERFADRLMNNEQFTRREFLDAQRSGRLLCPSCNLRDNKLPAVGAGVLGGVSTNAGASSGSLWGSLPSWRQIGEGLLDFLVSPGTANAPTLAAPRVGASGSWSGGGLAGGGFLLYPNKSNTNMMQSVYSK